LKPLERVVVYGSLGLRPGLSELLWAFRKRHKLEEFPVYLDDHPFQIYQRITSEIKNGMRTADVVMMPHYSLLRLSRENMLARHEAKEAGEYSAQFRDAKSRWFAAAVTFMSMAYSPRTLDKRSLPRSLEDLSSRELTGALGSQSLTASKAGNLGAHYIAFLKRRVGTERWIKFVETLAAANRPRTYDCIDHLLQGLLDGEHKLALTVYSLAYFREKTGGSSVALLKMDDAPQMFTFTSVGILRTSEGNDSAGRFLDFLLSEEAQKIVGTIPGLLPSRQGVKARYPVEVSFGPDTGYHPDEKDLREVADAVELFGRLGLP